MPWKPGDASRHTKKADTPAKKRQFSDVANSVRSKAMADGANEQDADAKAVRTANGVVKNHPSKKRR